MIAKPHIYMIPGFLGKPEDWDFMDGQEYVSHKVDIHCISEPSEGFINFSRKINRIPDREQNNILLGYSLGGRLALHAFRDDPQIWSAAIFVSTHLGLKTEEERQARLSNDYGWARRFIVEDWQSLLPAWNAQPVFNGSITPVRSEHRYNRGLLADSLRYWSLGEQEEMFSFISKIHVPILWIAGGKDSKFTQMAWNLHLKHEGSQVVIVPEAGHRLPWQVPEKFKGIVKGWLEKNKFL